MCSISSAACKLRLCSDRSLYTAPSLLRRTSLSHVKERENAFATEPVEGSDTLSMMTVTANYEGAYRDLMAFVHEIDRSPGLLVIESLNGSLQAGGSTLSVAMKIQAFVREEPAAIAKIEAAR